GVPAQGGDSTILGDVPDLGEARVRHPKGEPAAIRAEAKRDGGPVFADAERRQFSSGVEAVDSDARIVIRVGNGEFWSPLVDGERLGGKTGTEGSDFVSISWTANSQGPIATPDHEPRGVGGELKADCDSCMGRDDRAAIGGPDLDCPVGCDGQKPAIRRES